MQHDAYIFYRVATLEHVCIYSPRFGDIKTEFRGGMCAYACVKFQSHNTNFSLINLIFYIYWLIKRLSEYSQDDVSLWNYFEKES